MGYVPDWYALAQAAKYLGVPVPDIVHVPIWWIDKAFIAMTAEHEAQEIINAHRK